jgi:hypothetical protein
LFGNLPRSVGYGHPLSNCRLLLPSTYTMELSKELELG